MGFDADDHYLLLSAVPKFVQRLTGQRPHIATIHRWRQRGLRGVRLQTTFVGGHRRTTTRWLLELFDNLHAAHDGTPAAIRHVRSKSREQPSISSRDGLSQALDHLEKEGFLDGRQHSTFRERNEQA